jgi:glycosyltransferase involved in cell wall biosynthesis
MKASNRLGRVERLMGADLIVVAGGTDGLPGPVHQLMLRLLLDRQILWVDADAFFPAPAATGRAGNPSASGAFSDASERVVFGEPFEGAPMLPAKSPFPILTSSIVETDELDPAVFVSPLALSRRIRRAAGVLGLHRPMLWLASPWASVLAELFSGLALVYQHIPMARSAIEAGKAGVGSTAFQAAALRSAEAARQEAAIALRANLILAPTAESAARFDQHKTRLLANGVDTDLFATPAQRALDMPCDRPVVGFHGRIDERFDTEGVADLANQLPQWHFMLIGPVSTDVSRLQVMDNVTLTGCLPHEQLPRYSQYWTAAIMPFRVGAPPMPAVPLQLGEYLAAGLPVVGCGEQNLGRYSDLVSRADNVPALAQALRACADEPPSSRALRQKRQLADSWSIRAGFVNRLLDRLEVSERLPSSACDQVEAWTL